MSTLHLGNSFNPDSSAEGNAAQKRCSYNDGPRLLADIGGTNARFALELGPNEIVARQTLACVDYGTVNEAIRQYLTLAGVADIRHAALAIANPVDGDLIRMTNHHWQFSVDQVRRDQGFETLLVVNDFAALATTLPDLSADQYRQIGGGSPRAGAVVGLVGPGTGLGVSALVRCEPRWIVLATEGGHTTFAPADALESEILGYLRREHSHVSSERLISGPGIARIHRAIRALRGVPVERLESAEISRRAQAGSCDICVETVQTFSGMLGTFAGNVAVTLGSRGGIFLGGGVIGALGSAFDQLRFRERFQAKGRFESYLATIPTFEIAAEQPALRGAAKMLSEHLVGAVHG